MACSPPASFEKKILEKERGTIKIIKATILSNVSKEWNGVN